MQTHAEIRNLTFSDVFIDISLMCLGIKLVIVSKGDTGWGGGGRMGATFRIFLSFSNFGRNSFFLIGLFTFIFLN